MAAVTHGIATPDTSNTTSYVSTAFTPAANDLLIVFVVAVATVAAGSLTSSAGLTFTKFASAVKAAGADTLYAFVANQLAAASSQTVTFDCTGDAATNVISEVVRISGMTIAGLEAIQQFKVQSNGGTGAAPVITFDQNVDTNHPVLAFYANDLNPATITPPSTFTERNDTGSATPAVGAEYASVDSGFTSATITWGSNPASAWGGIIVELQPDHLMAQMVM